MARWVSITLLIALSASAAGAQTSPSKSKTWNIGRIAELPAFDTPAGQAGTARIIAGTEVAPNARIGFGLFGMKPDKSRHAPVTVREISEPKSRKAAVGFSLRF